ncbi:hypothetical protein OXB_1722 [Bacillus sp. OxB-1]|uniref:hypothetical protein n=1 Tax=Bacillus sp. (strain OxB-1) TaxID=98228 RepID=UPI0005820838|nr:hypothetical protein [Bacillus sp. OxB-1]BAQ10193.1 hypothetical protein OXB_1722 [Bacillus sp. OxB-1]
MSSSPYQEEIVQAIMELSGMIQSMRTEFGEGIGDLKKDVSVLKEDVSVLKKDVSVLKEDVNTLKEDMKQMGEKVEMIDAKFEVLNRSLLTTQAEVHRLKRA